PFDGDLCRLGGQKVEPWRLVDDQQIEVAFEAMLCSLQGHRWRGRKHRRRYYPDPRPAFHLQSLLASITAASVTSYGRMMRAIFHVLRAATAEELLLAS